MQEEGETLPAERRVEGLALSYTKIFLDTIEELDALTDEECGRLFRYLLTYARTGVTPTIEGNERFLFPVFKKRHDREVKAYDDLCEQRRAAGKAGGEAKRNNRQKKNASPPKSQDEDVAKEPAPKKSKKEVKPKVEYAEFITMTEEEHGKLIAEHGEQATQALIKRLDDYKGSTGKTYKSDYRTVLGWVTVTVQKEKPYLFARQTPTQGVVDPNRNPYE